MRCFSAPVASVAFAILCSTFGQLNSRPLDAAEPRGPGNSTTSQTNDALRDLKGYGLDGQLHLIGDSTEIRATVVVFLSTQCPISNSYVPQLNQLALSGAKRKLAVFGVVSGSTVSRAEAIAHRDEFGLRFPVLFDGSGELRSRLKPTHTPHAFVISSEGRIVYEGAIDDRYAAVGRKALKATENYLQEGVAAALAGKSAKVASVRPIGCLMEDEPGKSKTGEVTYTRDIAPILFANCASCHRPEATAPFSLLTYEDASRHARQIAELTSSRQMPPWKATAGFGHFKDERRLTDREIRLLSVWAETGKPEGEDSDLPARPVFSSAWRLGKPDLVLKMRNAFSLPAEGSDIHQHFLLPMGITTDRLISAIEFRPGNPKVIHHASFYLDKSGAARKLDKDDPAEGYGGGAGAGFQPQGTLRSWLPGQTPRPLAEGTGRPCPKGSDLVLEVHYRCSGKAETDQSMMGIYFAPRKARQLVGEMQIVNYDLSIPAGAKRHRHAATYTLQRDVVLLDCAPHLHLLGREVKATATRPDGQTIPLIWIKDWDFQWQEQYEYREPIRLPKGSRIDAEFFYDNSADNRLNPNSPPKTVLWGEQTRDEMGICHFQFTCDSIDDFIATNRHLVEHFGSQSAVVQAQRRAAAASSGGPAGVLSSPVKAATPAAVDRAVDVAR